MECGYLRVSLADRTQREIDANQPAFFPGSWLIKFAGEEESLVTPVYMFDPDSGYT